MHNALLQNQVKLLPVNDIAKLGNHYKMRHNNRALYFNQKKKNNKEAKKISRKIRSFIHDLTLASIGSKYYVAIKFIFKFASGENSSLNFGDELFSWTGQQN